MELTQLNNVNKNIITALSVANWTVDRIATASPQQLAALSGIGIITAKKLIGEAQRLVNKTLLAESQERPPSRPGYYRLEEIQRSARINRIYEVMQNET